MRDQDCLVSKFELGDRVKYWNDEHRQGTINDIDGAEVYIQWDHEDGRWYYDDRVRKI
jgi:hypothetical protein